MHIVELQMKLQARGDYVVGSSSSRIKARLASSKEDIRSLARGGLDSAEIAKVLDIPIDVVAAENPYIERYNEMKRKYLATGNLEVPGSGAGITIFQR